MYIKPPFKNVMNMNEIRDYNSTINPLSKEELKDYLVQLNLITNVKTNLLSLRMNLDEG